MTERLKGTVPALVALALLAAVLRVWGLSYGLPNRLARPDEEKVVGHALELSLGTVDRTSVRDPDLLYFHDPVWGKPQPASPVVFAYPYPDLVYDIDAIVLAAWRKAGEAAGAYGSKATFVDRLSDFASTAYTICRSISAIAGTLTVFAAFAAAWWGYGRRSIAWLAALLVAVNYLHARESHYATVDATMTLMVTWALAFAMKAAVSEKRRDVWHSAMWAGLAASAKFNGAAVILSTIVAASRRFLSPPSPRVRLRIFWTLSIAAVVMIAAFAATSPWCVRFAKSVHFGLRVQNRVLFGTVGPPAGLTFLEDTLPGAFGWPAFALVLVALGRALWKRRPVDWVVLAFVIPMFASMAGITWILPRYPLPLIPALAIVAAEAAVTLLAGRLPRWGWLLLIVVLAAPPLSRIVAYDRLASRPDTRVLAADWLEANLPAHARVAICRGYGAPFVGARQSPPAILPLLLLPCDQAQIEQASAHYVVTHTHPSIAYFAPTDDARAWLQQRAQPIATFSPFVGGKDTGACFYPGDAFYLPYCGLSAVERGGPVVTVWRVNGAPPVER